jgi:hypothetical protein
MNDAEARAILADHDVEGVPRKGKLKQTWHELAEGYRADTGGPDYDPGMSDADFAPETVTTAAEPPAEMAEAKPRKPARKPRTRPTLSERIKKATTGDGKPKKKQPRVNLAPLISNVWAGMGGMVARVDAPVGRCIMFQSEASGDILEDLVKGTLVDNALQPIARAEAKGRKAAALFGPPAVVALIERSQMLPEPQRKAREAILLPVLVSMLMLWDDVASDRAEERLERARLEGPRREQAEKLAFMILEGVAPAPAEPERETVGV